MVIPSDLEELTSALSQGSTLVRDPDIMRAYAHDQAHLAGGDVPCAVLLARGVQDVSVALRWANQRGVPVVPRGAGTGLSGGASALPGCLVISTAAMDRIHEISAADRLAVVDPGVITGDLDRAAEEVGMMYAPDPSSVDSCTIGGNVATNAGGLRCVKYGVTRDSVLGLQVVLADGRIIETGARTVKNVAGYDLTGLVVGSEGTLGVVTRVTVRLRPRPQQVRTVVAGFETNRQAADAVAAVLAAGLSPSLLEFLDRATLHAIDDWKNMGLGDLGAMLVAQTDGPDAVAAAGAIKQAFTAAGSDSVAVSESLEESRMLLEVRRLAYPATERLGRCLVEDVGVPPARLPDLIDRIEAASRRHGVRIMTVAHAGDGNTHPTFVFEATPEGDAPPQVWDAADEVFRAALDLGGTLSGEHGIGSIKQRWLGLQVGDDVLQVQAAVKKALDPNNILNPGRGI